MRRLQGCLLVLGGSIPLLIAIVAIRIWLTMPEEIDPASYPEHSMQLPVVGVVGAVEPGRQLARSLAAEEKLPGISWAVAIDGDLVWSEGVGWSDVEEKSAMTPELKFRIGSITRSLTALAVERLADRGAIDLDASTQDQLPGYPEKRWPLTPRHLLEGSSGLPIHRGEGGIFQGLSCDGDAERLALIAASPLQFEPGTESRYTNYDGLLLGALIAEVAGESYPEFLSREIFMPLEMRDTVIDVADEYEPGSAYFYYPRLMLNPSYGLHDAPRIDLSCFEAAVGFLSTPSDLVRFGATLLEGGELLGRMETRSYPWGRDGEAVELFGHGLGEPATRSFLSASSAAGNVAGSTVTLLIVPEQRIAIAVASNSSGATSVPTLALRLAELLVRGGTAP